MYWVRHYHSVIVVLLVRLVGGQWHSSELNQCFTLKQYSCIISPSPRTPYLILSYKTALESTGFYFDVALN